MRGLDNFTGFKETRIHLDQPWRGVSKNTIQTKHNIQQNIISWDNVNSVSVSRLKTWVTIIQSRKTHYLPTNETNQTKAWNTTRLSITGHRIMARPDSRIRTERDVGAGYHINHSEWICSIAYETSLTKWTNVSRSIPRIVKLLTYIRTLIE
jgi:hypothetical protein